MNAETTTTAAGLALIVSGVSGAGKSTIGTKLARRFRAPFIEGDQLHSEANKRKMSAGIALTDNDRWPWLDQIGDTIRRELAHAPLAVVSCSALARRYRDRLRDGCRPHRMHFAVLVAPREQIHERLLRRTRHFMPASLLDSQLATFEPPDPDECATTHLATQPMQTLIQEIAAAVELRSA